MKYFIRFFKMIMPAALAVLLISCHGVKKNALNEANYDFEGSSYKPACEDLSTEDFKIGLNKIESRAKKGEAKYQLVAGMRYFQHDNEKAEQWLLMASESTDENIKQDAEYFLGSVYFIEEKFSEAREHYGKSAELGNADSAYNLSIMYDDGKGGSADPEKSAELLMMCSKKEHPGCLTNLGSKIINGEPPFEKDYAKGIELLEKAAKLGDTQAIVNLAELSSIISERIKLFEEDAEKGDMEAQYRLAALYFRGDQIPQDYSLAAKWHRKAADQGKAESQLTLAYLLEKGLGVEKNLNEAKHYYELAAAKGNPAAQHQLAVMYITEDASTKDILKAETLLKKAAGQGYAKSQGLLGAMYELGAPGIKKNQKEAVKWYSKSAEAGDDVAQVRMGRMYYSGEYVKKDLKKAFELFKESAKHVNHEAIFYLGIMYFNGDGVEKNVKAAEELLKAAEERGYDAASVVLEAIKSGNDKIIIE